MCLCGWRGWADHPGCPCPLPYLEGASAFHFRFNTWAWGWGFLHAELPRRWGRLLSEIFLGFWGGGGGGKGEGRRVTAGSRASWSLLTSRCIPWQAGLKCLSWRCRLVHARLLSSQPLAVSIPRSTLAKTNCDVFLGEG